MQGVVRGACLGFLETLLPRELAAGSLGDARSSFCAVAAALMSLVSIMLLQSILSSISLHQPGTSELGSDFCFLWEWDSSYKGSILSVGKIINVKSQVFGGKYSKG